MILQSGLKKSIEDHRYMQCTIENIVWISGRY